ncbi:MAG: Alkaline serine exoprotease A precursor [uncultured Gemmatimonadetes bacterium]|uniref:Alkaline serine exoprotease A n=1 Tax=uncultured Gemmatimonadota bacterium TaxID=203437 RepID=A0A6J4K4H8_9BACT|nr:MAG: Alkaline serine exoprotease A precursor [uncultured Gemmatimonadota bacterium]
MNHRSLLLLLPFALLACTDAPVPTEPRAGASPVLAAAARPQSGDYIIVLKGPGAQAVAAAAGVSPRFVYGAALHGFAATLTEAQLSALRHNPNVAYVEADTWGGVSTTQTNPTWSLDRVDQRDLPLSGGYTYTATGATVNAYVLDSGIRKTHAEFAPAGRAQYIPNGKNGDFVNDAHGKRSGALDCNGHGTQVAGVVGGVTYGAAKGVNLWAGRVVNCRGGGQASSAIAAVDWITANGIRPAVVNMSLAYGDVQSLRTAVENSVAAGVHYATAAGNGDAAHVPIDACTESPGGAPNAVTVGATDRYDAEGYFSNYGPCIDLLAPGVDITTADDDSDTDLVTTVGTSVASPYVAGVIAMYLQNDPAATPATVRAALAANATSGRITFHAQSAAGGTPNLLLFTSY